MNLIIFYYTQKKICLYQIKDLIEYKNIYVKQRKLVILEDILTVAGKQFFACNIVWNI